MVTTVIAWPPHSRSQSLAALVRVATGLHSYREPAGRSS
jgi:hypothetical protein